jgi:hypothetical protein
LSSLIGDRKLEKSLQVVDKITIYGGAIKDPRARGGPEKIHRITPGLLLIKVEV